MEPFAQLKFWHRTALLPSNSYHVATLDGSDAEGEDNGPFFDLKLDVSNDYKDEGLYLVDNAVASSASEGDGEGEGRGGESDECSYPGDSSDCTSDDDTTTRKTAHFPVSLLKSARLRILMSGLKKPGSEPRQNSSRLFIKFKVEENISKGSSANKQDAKPSLAERGRAPTNEKPLLREATVHWYLKKVRLLYLGASKLRPSAMATATSASVAASRRDDSLMQQQDGIQGAILHCKRSFNESRGSGLTGSGRSASDPSHKKSMESSGESAE